MLACSTCHISPSYPKFIEKLRRLIWGQPSTSHEFDEMVPVALKSHRKHVDDYYVEEIHYNPIVTRKKHKLVGWEKKIPADFWKILKIRNTDCLIYCFSEPLRCRPWQTCNYGFSTDPSSKWSHNVSEWSATRNLWTSSLRYGSVQIARGNMIFATTTTTILFLICCAPRAILFILRRFRTRTRRVSEKRGRCSRERISD